MRTLFQPTLPARGATRVFPCEERTRRSHFNPRSPHGERPPPFPHTIRARRYFNPRSPHGERRRGDDAHLVADVISTHAPRTGSDDLLRLRVFFFAISTHAPRTGSDSRDRPDARTVRDFNPRSPHGERPSKGVAFVSLKEFQPTLPARGATGSGGACVCLLGNFNPRSPHGERLDALVSY